MTRRIQALHVGNFKAFADTQRIPIKPITLIFGPNSAGKSTIIQAIALAHEAQLGRDKRSHSRLDVRHTDVGGSAIELGGFQQFVHRRDPSRSVEWGAEIPVDSLPGNVRDCYPDAQFLKALVRFGIELDDVGKPKSGSVPRVESVDISADGRELLRLSRRRTTKQSAESFRVDYIDTNHPVTLSMFKGFLKHFNRRPTKSALAAIAKEYEIVVPNIEVKFGNFFPNEASDVGGLQLFLQGYLGKKGPTEMSQGFASWNLTQAISSLISDCFLSIESELRKFQYLGPLRSLPGRDFSLSGKDDYDLYAGGGYAWELVKHDSEVRDAVNRWLGSDKLKTPYQLQTRSYVAADKLAEHIESGLFELQETGLTVVNISEDRHFSGGHTPLINSIEEEAEKIADRISASDIDRTTELTLVDLRTNTRVTHRDVGIGISQVLPVLVMAYGSREKVLAMEQPEIHLHPALQAELADVFIESALGERKNTFLLETHSEHLILRIMRRIRESSQHSNTGRPRISPDDVSILYVEPIDGRSVVREMPLNEAGELIKAWPGGFFEEGIREQFGDDSVE